MRNGTGKSSSTSSLPGRNLHCWTGHSPDSAPQFRIPGYSFSSSFSPARSALPFPQHSIPQGRILRAFSTGRRVYRTASSAPLPTTNAGLEMSADQASFCRGNDHRFIFPGRRCGRKITVRQGSHSPGYGQHGGRQPGSSRIANMQHPRAPREHQPGQGNAHQGERQVRSGTNWSREHTGSRFRSAMPSGEWRPATPPRRQSARRGLLFPAAPGIFPAHGKSGEE